MTPVFLYAFDLIELNGDDLRRDPLEVRKATLASVLAKAGPGLRLNEHIEADGPTVFAHASLGRFWQAPSATSNLIERRTKDVGHGPFSCPRPE
jgi:hypothetical protein